MKRLLFLLTALLTFSHLNAQTCGNGFLLQLILPDGSMPIFGNEDGGYGCAYYSTSVVQEMQGEVVWGRTAAGDSLGCDTIVTDLTNKFALVRLGSCEYSQKSHLSYLAGASAIIIVNHYNFANHDDNTIINLGIVDGGQMPQIPCILVCRKVGNLIANAIDNDLPVTAKFVFSTLSKPNVAYHYATPKNQLDTLKHISVHFFNPTADTLRDALVKAEITEPGGNVVNLSVPVASLAPRQDTLLFFPPYLPPPTVGDFDVVFSNTAFSEPYDTMSRRFRVTEYTWASDNHNLLPGGFRYLLSDILPGSYFQPGALYRTGSDGGKAAQAIFGLVGADQLDTSGGYAIGAVLYDADEDNDGVINFSGIAWNSGWDDFMLPVGWGSYEVTGNEADNALIAMPMADIASGQGAVNLKPRHWYYLTLLITDFGDPFNLTTLSATPKQNYFFFPSAPAQVEYTLYPEVTNNATIVQRLASENDVIEPLVTSTKSPLLDPSKFTLFPNPANEIVQLNLSLEAVNKKVAATLLNWQGRAVASEQCIDCQESTLTFSAQNLPSGIYLMWVRTEEGTAMRKVMICH